jgi:antitoxin PrlF
MSIVDRSHLQAYPYITSDVRSDMDVSARLSSKGQLTVPRSVREALSLNEGDRVVFRVEGDRAILAKTPDLIALAGSISVPAAKRGMAWSEIQRETHRSRAVTRR